MGGNSGARKRHWCFTSFQDSFAPHLEAATVRYCIYQEESCPETKRIHVQGYIEFYENYRIGQVKAVLGDAKCHVEPRMGSRTQARDYCRKPETAIAGTQVEFGMWRMEVTRKRKLSDMLRTDMTLADIIDTAPHLYVLYNRGLGKLFSYRSKKKYKKFRKVVVTVLVGKTGTGKTRRAMSGEFGDDWYSLPSSEKLWFDGYDGEKTLIIDDFYGGIKYGIFLKILDGHAQQVPFKGGFHHAQWTAVIITSNAEPDTWYKYHKLANLDGTITALGRRISTIIRL